MITAIDIGRGTVGVASGLPGQRPSVSRCALRDGRLAPLSRSPFAILLRNWRLRRVRWAFATLNRRLSAYERAYGGGTIQLTDDDRRTAGLTYKGD